MERHPNQKVDMKKLTLTDAYSKGGYWGFLFGASLSGLFRYWPENKAGWITTALIFLAIYLWRFWLVHKQEEKE